MKNSRFFTKVKKGKGCWIWLAYKDANGYGKLSWVERGHPIHAHRASWIIHYGKIPQGHCVLHRCDNPPCVRPDHLFLGTQIDNIRDMVRKRRQRSAIGENNFNSKLTAQLIYEIRILASTGRTYRSLGAQFGVSHGMIGHIVKKRAWSHLR